MSRIGRAVAALSGLAIVLMLTGTAHAAEGAREPHAPPGGWSFEGVFGLYDQAALQRGFQVYKEVCSTCHSMKLVAFRNLGEEGGPGFSEAEVKTVAAEFSVPAGPSEEDGSIVDENGMPRTRPALPSDRFFGPYANEFAARAANGGALPPDLSVMAKARMGGPSYIYSLLQCYEEPPPGFQLQPGMSYNPCMSGGQIAMPPQLVPDRVAYHDGTPATVEQMAKDVATFLNWAAEPELQQRKKLGFMVLVYLVVLAGLLYLAYRRVWRDVGH